MKRQLLGALLLAALVLTPAEPVFAHGGNGGPSSDYRIEVTGFDGDARGIEVRPVELGNRMELVRTTAKDVQILGYEGEPYIRLDSSGAYENINSPANYLNLDRFARQPTPESATASAEPRQDVREDPSVERVIFPANRVDLVVDGRQTAAIVEVTWLPPPSRMTWLVITSLAACLLLTALVLPVGASLLITVLSVTHFEVFEHQLLAGAVPAVVQRAGVTLALALAAAVVGSELLVGLGATTRLKPAVAKL